LPSQILEAFTKGRLALKVSLLMRSASVIATKSEYGLFLFSGSQNEKRPPTAWKFEMSNKIAQVSLDFAGTGSMCAGNKVSVFR
jgi:hypothetical protein